MLIDFIVKLHQLACDVFNKQNATVVTVGAGHVNHHFADDKRDCHPNSFVWLDFESQIQHKRVLLEQELSQASYRRVILVGHSIGAYVCITLFHQCNLKARCNSSLVLLMPYIRHSNLPNSHKKQLETFHLFDPFSTWFVCLLLSFMALLLPAAWKKYLVQQYAVLPPDICPLATATKLFTPRMVFNHFYMVVMLF